MIQKKICMVGSFAVGKTSLVSRFVHSIFSDKYLTTVGVKIDKKVVTVSSRELMLMLWDLAGKDDYQELRPSYVRGAAGYLLVADGTRAFTLDVALQLQKDVESFIGKTPFVLVLNKTDLIDEWQIKEPQIEALRARGWEVIMTSAKQGQSVEEAFITLGSKIVDG